MTAVQTGCRPEPFVSSVGRTSVSVTECLVPSTLVNEGVTDRQQFAENSCGSWVSVGPSDLKRRIAIDAGIWPRTGRDRRCCRAFDGMAVAHRSRVERAGGRHSDGVGLRSRATGPLDGMRPLLVPLLCGSRLPVVSLAIITSPKGAEGNVASGAQGRGAGRRPLQQFLGAPAEEGRPTTAKERARTNRPCERP